MPKTQGIQIAKTIKFFSALSTMLTMDKVNEAIMAAKELVHALKNLNTAKNLRLTPSHYDSLTKLACIFYQATKKRIKNKTNTP